MACVIADSGGRRRFVVGGVTARVTLFLLLPGADFPGLQAAAGENLFTDAIASSDSQELELAEETEMEGEDFGADDDWQGLNDITLNAYASAASRVSLNRNIITEVTELVTEDDAGGIGGHSSCSPSSSLSVLFVQSCYPCYLVSVSASVLCFSFCLCLLCSVLF